jgi:hypothetical protein
MHISPFFFSFFNTIRFSEYASCFDQYHGICIKNGGVMTQHGCE